MLLIGPTSLVPAREVGAKVCVCVFVRWVPPTEKKRPVPRGIFAQRCFFCVCGKIIPPPLRTPQGVLFHQKKCFFAPRGASSNDITVSNDALSKNEDSRSRRFFSSLVLSGILKLAFSVRIPNSLLLSPPKQPRSRLS